MRGAVAVGTLAMAVLVTTGACRVATVRKLDEKAAPANGAAAPNAPFDVVAFVDSIWTSEVLRSLDEARDVASIVDDAGRTPGAPENGGTCVAVRGRGRVVGVDTRSRSGTATIALDVKTGATVVVQIGPVLTGTAIRDALPALGFDRFLNQIQHADVGNELNARVERELEKLDRRALRGRRVAFSGMAPVEPGRSLTITPVRLELEAEP